MNNFIPQQDTGEYEILIDDKKVTFLYNHNPNSQELIVFFHGLACTKDSFKNVFDYPDFLQHSLLLIDLIGFGGSSKTDNFSYSMEEQAALCEELINHFPGFNLHLAAHSMGGAICLLFSKQLFKRVISFANLEGNLISEDCGLFSRAIAGVSFDEYKSSLFEKHKIEYADFDMLKFDKTTPTAMYRSAQSLVKHSDSGKLLEKYKKLTCKKAYFFGAKNIDMKVLDILDCENKIMISKSGHGMMLDNAEEFYSKLYKFLFS